MSQPIVFNNDVYLSTTNYNPSVGTVVLIHNKGGSATDVSNAILVPALLAAADVNVLVVDWSAATADSDVLTTFYSALSANFVSRFLNWISEAGDGDLENFHLVGVGFGSWNAGVIGLRLRRQVGYITALDPSRGPALTGLIPALTLGVAKYVEVIHADIGQTGYSQPLGHADFYPNGGGPQPGCGGDSECNRNRAVYFFAESVQSGGFTGIGCENWRAAAEGNCHGPETLNMGGLQPKTGSRGIFHLTTNVLPPFSQG